HGRLKGEEKAAVMGDFAANGWTVGAPMTSDGTNWTVTIPLPWNKPVQYKLRINGDTWIPDPNNPNQVDDGFGGKNSVREGMTCEWWSCDAGNIGTFDWRDSIIYFVFVDRFNNGDKGNDGPIGVEKPADWQGGDWAGVTAKIEEGYFTDLGVNTLWLSVPMDNTSESGKGVGGDSHMYSAYHGYWPQNIDATEEHFGTLAELQALVDAAHQRDIKVIVDYAMNHVHASSPLYADHKDWFWPNDNGKGGNCVCGEGCAWDGGESKKCWFTDYLPDFNFTNGAARDASVSNAIQWIVDAGIDGFRLDAVKHIEDSWLLDLRARVKSEIEAMTMEHFYMVGETYTGDRDLIKYYVKPEMLDGQFDFPWRMKVAENLIMRQGSMKDLESFMNSNDGYYGTGVMSPFIGNHDIPRVIHLAEDTPVWASPWDGGKDKAWAGTPTLPGGTSAFERVTLGFTLLLTTPGASLIYYGDEVGLPGGGDPDNRRFMQWSGYSAGQQLVLDRVKKLTAIRAAHEATRRGTRSTLSVTDDTMAYSMSGGGDTVYVVLNRSDAAQSVGGLPAGSLSDELGGGMVQGPTVMVPARGAMVLSAP
ncbi:MAG TPA: alpha-amylase family glycosyl hydrolase, partial [Nannocystaceae bacterium]|nr:alpha-amylase family glycosyl hydrolase [Nannocystaceae bacterium]